MGHLLSIFRLKVSCEVDFSVCYSWVDIENATITGLSMTLHRHLCVEGDATVYWVPLIYTWLLYAALTMRIGQSCFLIRFPWLETLKFVTINNKLSHIKSHKSCKQPDKCHKCNLSNHGTALENYPVHDLSAANDQSVKKLEKAALSWRGIRCPYAQIYQFWKTIKGGLHAP